MRRLRLWLSAPFGVAVAAVVLLAMVLAATDVAGIRGYDPFGRSSTLDYSAPPFGGFFPLRAPFVGAVLGEQILTPGAPAAPNAHTPGSTVSDPPDAITHPLTNDDSTHAYEIFSVPFTARSDTSGATRESGEPSECARVGSSVWYRYRATQSGTLVATAVAGYPIALGAYVAPLSRSSSAVACDSGAQGRARVAFPAFAGTTYLFQVTNEVRGGRLVFSLDREAQTTPVSTLPDGRYAGATFSWGYPKVSGNGRYVAFGSASPGLDRRCAKHSDGTLPCGSQIYIRDIGTGLTELASLTDSGSIPNESSYLAGVSDDGRYVVWHTRADNMGTGSDLPDSATNDKEYDVFLRDRMLHRTERITVAADGSELNGGDPSISSDGRFVAFGADFEHRTNPFNGLPLVSDVYVKDRATGEVSLVSQGSAGERGNHDSRGPIISPDGGYVVFWSRATNLSAGPNIVDEAYNQAGIYQGRVYVYDLHRKQLSLECAAEDGTPANDHCFGYNISAFGRYSVFWSSATNLIAQNSSIPDANQIFNLYLRDRVTGHLELINVTDDGRAIGEIWRQELLFGGKRTPQPYISADASIVGFDTDVALTPGDENRRTDAFVRDRVRGRTIRVSETPTGGDANGTESEWPCLSADGSIVAFISDADNLAAGDTNKTWDIFVRLWRA